jgi:hypothetical protein
VAGEGESTRTLATGAAMQALEVAGVNPAALDLIIVATATPDHAFPSTASLVQDALGADRAGAEGALRARQALGLLLGQPTPRGLHLHRSEHRQPLAHHLGRHGHGPEPNQVRAPLAQPELHRPAVPVQQGAGVVAKKSH